MDQESTRENDPRAYSDAFSEGICHVCGHKSKHLFSHGERLCLMCESDWLSGPGSRPGPCAGRRIIDD